MPVCKPTPLMSFTPKPEVEAEVLVEVEVEVEVVVEIVVETEVEAEVEVEVEVEFELDVEVGVDDVCVDAEVEIEVEIEVEAEAPTPPLPPHSPFLLLPLLSLADGRRVGDRASMSLSMSLLFVLPSLPVASVERQRSVMAGASGQCLTLVGLGLRSIPMASPAVSTARFATAMVATEFLVAFLAAAILSSRL